MNLYRELDQGKGGHWHDIGAICRCGLDCTNARLRMTIPATTDYEAATKEVGRGEANRILAFQRGEVMRPLLGEIARMAVDAAVRGDRP